MNETKRVVAVPCSGIGKTYGTVGREAAYELVETLRQTQAEVVALSLLVLGDAATQAQVRAAPAIFDQLYGQGKRADTNGIGTELLEMTRLYNSMDEAAIPGYETALRREFAAFCRKKER